MTDLATVNGHVLECPPIWNDNLTDECDCDGLYDDGEDEWGGDDDDGDE